MLSLRLLKVSGVLLPERLANSNSNNASSSSEVGFKEMMPVSSWTVQLRHGSQQHRTQFAAVDSGNQALPPVRRDGSGSLWQDRFAVFVCPVFLQYLV